MFLHSAPLTAFSFLQALVQRSSPCKSLPLFTELWDGPFRQWREGERPPATKVRFLQGRGRAEEVSPWTGDRQRQEGPIAPTAQSSCASHAPSAGKNNARQDPSSFCSFSCTDFLHDSFHLPQGPRVIRAEPSPSRGRKILSVRSQDEELTSHVLPSSFASNMSSRL